MNRIFNGILEQAYREHRAAGSFNWYHFETLKGIIEAGQECGQPVIASFGAKYLTNMDLDTAAVLTENLAKKSDFPVCLHLDHSSSIDTVIRAVRAGFDSVMYDGSALPFEENLKNTKYVCDIAHACGAGVEAELGTLAAGLRSHEGSSGDRERYTDPAMAAEFAAETGVDALAVSIGTVHGMYKDTPNIRVDILKEINAAAGVPLVLHGGSGTPEEKILACIDNGISKINVNTEISEYVLANTKELLRTESPHISVLALKQKDWVKETVCRFIRLFMNGK